MHVVGQVVDGPAVAEVRVLDHADAFEHVHRSVDRGEMGAWHGVVDTVDEVVGREVAVSRDEVFDDGSPGWCDALALATEVSKERLDAIGHRLRGYGREPGAARTAQVSFDSHDARARGNRVEESSRNPAAANTSQVK